MSFCETVCFIELRPRMGRMRSNRYVGARRPRPAARAPLRHARRQREFHSAPVSRGVSTRFRHNRQRTFRGVPARDARRGACASGAGGVVRGVSGRVSML